MRSPRGSKPTGWEKKTVWCAALGKPLAEEVIIWVEREPGKKGELEVKGEIILRRGK